MYRERLVDDAVRRIKVEGEGSRPHYRLKVKVDGLMIESSVEVQDRLAARLATSLWRNDQLKGQVRKLWTTRRGRSAWLLFVEVLASLSQQCMPDDVRRDFSRKTLGLVGIHLAAAYLMGGLIRPFLAAFAGFFLEGRAFAVLALSFTLQVSRRPLGSACTRRPERWSYCVLAFHTLWLGLVGGAIEVALPAGWVPSFLLIVSASMLVATPIAARGVADVRAALCVGWLVGASAAVAVAGASAICGTAASLSALCLLLFGCESFRALQQGNPDKCFVVVSNMCHAVAMSMHAYICLVGIVRLLVATSADVACFSGLMAPR